MPRPLRLLLGSLGAVLALAAAYAAGVLFPVSLPASRPADVRPLAGADFAKTIETIDYAAAVDVITSVRIHGHEADLAPFASLVDSLHGLVLAHIAARLALTPEEQAYVLDAYTRESASAVVDYASLLAPGPAHPVEAATNTLVTYQSYDAVNEFVGVLSGHVCGLLHFPGRVLLGQARGLVGRERVEKTLGPGLSCDDVLGETLAPLAYALRRQAVIHDLNTSQLTITSQVRRMVAELATAEETITAEFSDAYATRVLFLKSTATVHARARGTVKAGFDLNRGFGVEIDHDARRFLVHLPEPQILSSDVEVEFTGVDNGVFASIDLPRYNAALVRAREMVRERARQTGLLGAARRNAEQLVVSIFQPVMALPQFGYDVYVVFPGRAPARHAPTVPAPVAG